MCSCMKRVRSAAAICFFGRQVVELEKRQRGFFENIKQVQLKKTKEVKLQHILDEEGRLLRDKRRICER